MYSWGHGFKKLYPKSWENQEATMNSSQELSKWDLEQWRSHQPAMFHRDTSFIQLSMFISTGDVQHICSSYHQAGEGDIEYPGLDGSGCWGSESRPSTHCAILSSPGFFPAKFPGSPPSSALRSFQALGRGNALSYGPGRNSVCADGVVPHHVLKP